jgi:hypothetical protein
MSSVKEVEELRVKRHVKLSSKLGTVDVHASDSTLGAWIGNGKRCVGIHEQRGEFHVVVYDDMKQLPVAAIGTTGIQLRDKNGQPRLLSWLEVLAKFE